jgi:hypothetical protein
MTVISFSSVQVVVASDVTAPVLSSPTAVQTGQTTANGTVTTDEGNGTLYFLASQNASENVATIKAGSSQAVSATGAQNVSITGLTASTAYYLHYVHTDAASNDSNVVSSAQFTTAAVPSGNTIVTFSSIQVVAPVFGVSVDNANPQAGNLITFTISNGTGPYTATFAGEAITLDSQNATTATYTFHDIKTFGAKTARYNVAQDFIFTDTNDSDTDTVSATPAIPTGYDYSDNVVGGSFASVPGFVDGDNVLGYYSSGAGIADLATGSLSPDDETAVFTYWIQDDSDNVWGASGQIDWGVSPAGTVTIDSIVPDRTSAVITFSYPGADLTGFQYNIGAGWLSAISPLSLTGLTEDTLYTIQIRAVNNATLGAITSDTFTTTSQVDTTPNAFSFTSQTGVALSAVTASNAITVQGVDAGVDIPISIANGEYSVSTDSGATWGAWTATATNVRLNYQIRVRHTDSATHATDTVTTLTIGGVVGTFTSTTLADTVDPVITLVGGNMSVAQGSNWIEPGYTATDNADGDLTDSVIVTGSVNTAVLGPHTLGYSVTDAAGNTGSATRLVTVGQINATITLSEGGIVLVQPGAAYTDQTVSATDSLSVDVSNTAVWSGDTVDSNADLLNRIELTTIAGVINNVSASQVRFTPDGTLPAGVFKYKATAKDENGDEVEFAVGAYVVSSN